MSLDTSCHREEIGVENDVFGQETNLFDQKLVGARADFDFSVFALGLACHVKSYYDDGNGIGADQSCVM